MTTATLTLAEIARDYLRIKHQQNHSRHPGLSEWLCPFGACPEIRREIEKAEDGDLSAWYERWVG